MLHYQILVLSVGLLSLTLVNTYSQVRTPVKERTKSTTPSVTPSCLVDQASNFLASSDQEEKQITQAILTSFAQMAGCIIQIASDPYNPVQIIQNFGMLATNIGHIIVQALKKRRTLDTAFSCNRSC